jgi:hypothetical protein
MNGPVDPPKRDPPPFEDELPKIEQVQPGSSSMPSVDPVGTPWDDPLPPEYKAGHPAELVTDHRLARSMGGPDVDWNTDPRTREGNGRKGGFEGNYLKDLARYMRGFPGRRQSRAGAAQDVLQGEFEAIPNDIHPRPVPWLERPPDDDFDFNWRDEDAPDVLWPRGE